MRAPLALRPRRTIIRVAAGPSLGFGHLMRARAMAQALRTEVVLSVRGGSAARAAAARIAPLVQGLDALRRADLLIVDDPSLERGLPWVVRARREGMPIVSVHDAGRTHAADLVICPGLGQPAPAGASPALVGPRYYLLDPRVSEARSRYTRRRRSQRPRVIIALGGGMHVRRVAQQLVDAIVSRRPDAEISVAAGFAASPQSPLVNATWLTAPTGLAGALSGADVAVVAGGVTLYEACAIGVPAVGFAVVDGQRRAIRAFASQGALVDAGSGPGAIERAARGVARLIADAGVRAGTAAAARKLIDGRGTERVARAIERLAEAGRARCA